MPRKEGKKEELSRRLSFCEQTPKIQLVPPSHDPLYEKAYLHAREEGTSDYDRNTATWD